VRQERSAGFSADLPRLDQNVEWGYLSLTELEELNQVGSLK
jgi:hypothetical protein